MKLNLLMMFIVSIFSAAFSLWFIYLAGAVALLPKILLVLAGIIAGGIVTLLVIVLIVLAALRYFPHF
ncbi:MAG: hypothetical protein Q7K40_05395 [bacterium]|nr:hypothetical protein [bacterium]